MARKKHIVGTVMHGLGGWRHVLGASRLSLEVKEGDPSSRSAIPSTLTSSQHRLTVLPVLAICSLEPE